MTADDGREDPTTEGTRRPGGTGPPPGDRRSAGDGPADDSSSGWMLLGVLTVLLLVGGAGLYLGLSGDGADGAAGSPGETADGDRISGEAGGPTSVPAEVVDFPTLEGDTASLAEYRGQVVLLNLWGTWCPPCRREIPDLVELQERIEPRGGTVVGLAVDSGSPSSIRDFVGEFEINYPIWYAPGKEVVRHYRAVGYPTTLLIDTEGIIRRRYLGPQTAEALMRDVEPLLPEG